MIVNRREMLIKPGRMEEALALAKSGAREQAVSIRLYQYVMGPFNMLVWEADFESMAEYEKIITKWYASPQGVENLSKLRDTFVGPGQQSLLRVID